MGFCSPSAYRLISHFLRRSLSLPAAGCIYSLVAFRWPSPPFPPRLCSTAAYQRKWLLRTMPGIKNLRYINKIWRQITTLLLEYVRSNGRRGKHDEFGGRAKPFSVTIRRINFRGGKRLRRPLYEALCVWKGTLDRRRAYEAE